MSDPKAIVLLSSGLDSTVNLFESNLKYDVVLALTFNYGQRAFEKERSKSIEICESLNINHKVLDVSWLQGLSTQSSLTNLNRKVPTDEVDINSYASSVNTAKAVWVSNRNGLFINIAACYAEELHADKIIVGFNKEEAATFPDNSAEFINSINSSLSFSTQNQVEVESFTIHMNKQEIVARGIDLEVDFNKIWPCYSDQEQLCGECESCKRYLSAMSKNKS